LNDFFKKRFEQSPLQALMQLANELNLQNIFKIGKWILFVPKVFKSSVTSELLSDKLTNGQLYIIHDKTHEVIQLFTLVPTNMKVLEIALV